MLTLQFHLNEVLEQEKLTHGNKKRNKFKKNKKHRIWFLKKPSPALGQKDFIQMNESKRYLPTFEPTSSILDYSAQQS